MSEGLMQITVLLFGACREAAGVSEFKCELTAPSDVARAFAEIKRQYPMLENFERSALFAVNEEHARPAQSVHEGDTLAIFPPVSGG